MKKLEDKIGGVAGAWALYYNGYNSYPNILTLNESGQVLGQDFTVWSISGPLLFLHDQNLKVEMIFRYDHDEPHTVVLRGQRISDTSVDYLLVRCGAAHPFTDLYGGLEKIEGDKFLKKLHGKRDFSVDLIPEAVVPINIDQTVSSDVNGAAEFILKMNSYVAHPVYFHVLNEAKIISAFGVENAEGKYLVETAFVSDLYTGGMEIKLHPHAWKKVEYYADVVPLGRLDGLYLYFDQGGGPSHFIHQTLPNLYILSWLEAQGVDLSTIKLVFKQGLYLSHMKGFLECCGLLNKIPESSFINLAEQPNVFVVEKLIYPSFSALFAPYLYPEIRHYAHFAFPPIIKEIYEHVKEKALAQIKDREKYKDKFIFIYRRKETRRPRLLNEIELLRALEPLGFVGVDVADYNAIERTTIFDQAQFVVACIGGGLSHIVFCRPGTYVLELLGSIVLDPVYSRLGSIMGLKCAMMNFPAVDLPDDAYHLRSDRCFRADIPAVLETVKKILTKINRPSESGNTDF